MEKQNGLLAFQIHYKFVGGFQVAFVLSSTAPYVGLYWVLLMVCPKTSSNREKKKIVEEAGEKRMKLRAKLRKGSTTGCQMGGWMDRH